MLLLLTSFPDPPVSSPVTWDQVPVKMPKIPSVEFCIMKKGMDGTWLLGLEYREGPGEHSGVSPSHSGRNNRKDSQNGGKATRLQVEDTKEEWRRRWAESLGEGPHSHDLTWDLTPGTLLATCRLVGYLHTTILIHSLAHQVIIECPPPRIVPGCRGRMLR